MATPLPIMLTRSKPLRRRRVLMFSVSVVAATAVFTTALPGAPAANSATRSTPSVAALCDQATKAVAAGYTASQHSKTAHRP